jgi:hypothetical protein
MNFHAVILILQNNYYLANEGTLDPEMNYSISELYKSSVLYYSLLPLTEGWQTGMSDEATWSKS